MYVDPFSSVAVFFCEICVILGCFYSSFVIRVTGVILAPVDNALISAEKLASLAGSFGIRLLLLFGSAVSGSGHSGSDTDLAVLLENPDLDLHSRSALQHALQRLFPEREVDVAIINHADPLFLKKITERCRLLYGDPADFYSLKMYAFRRYQDHGRFLQLERRYVKSLLNRVGQGT
jgi:uncharacterized protein